MDQKVNTETGEIITVTPRFQLPAKGTIKRVSEVAGKNPEMVNLRDHPEFDGRDCMIFSARIAAGDYGDYAITTAAVYPADVELTEENKDQYIILLSSGSENFLERVIATMQADAFPILGTLRNAGKAWFLD